MAYSSGKSPTQNKSITLPLAPAQNAGEKHKTHILLSGFIFNAGFLAIGEPREVARDKSFLEPTALNCSHLLPSPPIPNTSSLSSPPADDLASHFTKRAEAVGRNHAHTTIIVSSLPALVPQPLPWPPFQNPHCVNLMPLSLLNSTTSLGNNCLFSVLPYQHFPGLGHSSHTHTSCSISESGTFWAHTSLHL